jgi:hypothetical protein
VNVDITVGLEVLTALNVEITVRLRGSLSHICGDYCDIRGSHDGDCGDSFSRV